MKSVIAFLAVAALPASGLPQAAAPAPSCDSAEHRQFDFWIGDWVVADSTGKAAGKNRIERAIGGCVLHEHWTAADGSSGESFSIYDQWAHRWHQTWVDSHGLLLQLDGGLRSGSMVLQGERVASDGRTRVRHRITWSPLDGGRVRQHWQRSRDNGKTWEDVFDGTYTRSDL